MKTDPTALQTTIREETLFSIPFTTPISMTQTADLELAILTSWQQSETSKNSFYFGKKIWGGIVN